MTNQVRLTDCPACGAENYAYASFCIACGEPMDCSDQPAIQLPNQRDRQPTDQLAQRDKGRVSRPRQRWRRRETVLGLALCLLTLAYVAYDWQRNQNEAASYAAGLTAQKSKDWDRAATDFQRAGSHLDAAARYHQAAYQIGERDRLYNQGIDAAAHRDWEGAVTAFEQVQTIEPGFSDSADRLVQARTEAFNLGLAGVVYLVSQGDSQGLYLLDKKGVPQHLAGSDGQSTIGAVSTDGQTFIYDRPPTPGDLAADQASASASTFHLYRGGRVAVLATLSAGKLSTVTLSDVDGEGHGYIASGNVWWYSGWYATAEGVGYRQYEVYHASQSEPAVAALRLAGPFSRDRVIAIDPSRSLLVMGQAEGEPGTAHRQTRLYLADARGVRTSPEQVVPGDVEWAELSRDASWLLYESRVQRNSLTDDTVWVQRVASGALLQPPRRLIGLSTLGTPDSEMLTASFVPDNQSQRVVVDRVTQNSEQLSLFDLSTGGTTVVWNGLAGQINVGDVSGFGSRGQYLATRRQFDFGALLEMMDVSRPDFIRRWDVPLAANPAQQVVAQFSPRDNYLVATVSNGDNPKGSSKYIYTAPISKSGEPGVMHQIAIASEYSGDTLPTTTFTPDGSLLAFVTGEHELRAVSYDGKLDALVAQGVGAVWSITGQPSRLWAR